MNASINVAYLDCTGDLWLNVAKRMSEVSGWKPVYWSGAERMAADVAAAFPNTFFHENTSAVKGILPPGLEEAELPPLDAEVLEGLSHVQPHALAMMDRMDPDGSLGFHERTRLYHRHVRISLAIIARFKPALVIFPATPHLVYDYVFYYVCRVKRLPTVLFVETAVDGLMFAVPQFENAGESVRQAYEKFVAGGESATLTRTAQVYWEKLQGEYGKAIPQYILDLHEFQPEGRQESPTELAFPQRVSRMAEHIERTGNLSVPESSAEGSAHGAELTSKLRGLRRLLTRKVLAKIPFAAEFLAIWPTMRLMQRVLLETGRVQPSDLRAAIECTMHFYRAVETEYPIRVQPADNAPRTYLTQFGVPPEQSDMSYVEYWLYRMMGLRKKHALLMQYTQLVEPLPVGAPYVYVPLQYQPEVSTSPLAGPYVDQALMVEILSKTVPEGWFVCVRENPFQFDKKGSGELSRDFNLYSRLVQLPNVRLASIKASPFDLIDGAKAVATATGTSGWEAVVRGVPTLAFGDAWYVACEGVFPVSRLEKCREAIGVIEKGYRPDREKVRKFLFTLESIGFRGFTIPDLEYGAGVTAQDNVSVFARILSAYDPAKKDSAKENVPPLLNAVQGGATRD